MQIQSGSQKTYRTAFGVEVPIIDTSEYNRYRYIAAGLNGSVEVCVTPDDKFRVTKTLHPYSSPVSILDSYREVDVSTQMDRELRACLFNHPSIINIHGVNLEKNQIIMNWYQHDLGTLSFDITRKRRFSILYELADALVVIHGGGIIHSDIKPGNILLSDTNVAILADFGASLLNDQAYRYGQIHNHEKYIYCSPEKLGNQTVDISTDIFSLGILAYALHLGNDLNTTIGFMKLRGEIPSLRHFAPGEDRDICAALSRCVSLDKSKRPSALEIREILKSRVTREKQEILQEQQVLREYVLNVERVRDC